MSFQKAIKIECQRTELDVWITADDHVVVFHDETLGRLFPGDNRRIENLTLAEIKVLDLQGQKIPTLQEVFDICKGKIDLQIELKGRGTPQPVNELIVKNKIESEVLVTSFNIDLLKEVKKINPALKVGLLFEKTPEQLWCIATQTLLNYICPKADMVTEEMVKIAHAMCVKVYAYHTNNIESGFKMLNLSVDDIGTDFPNLFLSNNY